MARKRLIAGVAVALAIPSISLAQTCPAGMNKSEIGARYLVSEFMVAALSCHRDPAFRDSYASFVRRYNAGLVGNAQAMKAHLGGGLDSFVTRLANHAALRQNDGNYCSHARLRIDRALSAQKTATLTHVVQNLGYAQGGPACDDSTPVAALNSKEPIGSDKVEPAKAAPATTVSAAPAKPAAATPTPTPVPPTPQAEPAAKAADTGIEAAPPMPAPGGGSEFSPTP